MVEISKESVRQTIKHLNEKFTDGPLEVDMIFEVSKMMTSLLLCCVLGQDESSTQLDYYENGRLIKKDLSFMLRTCF